MTWDDIWEEFKSTDEYKYTLSQWILRSYISWLESNYEVTDKISNDQK